MSRPPLTHPQVPDPLLTTGTFSWKAEIRWKRRNLERTSPSTRPWLLKVPPRGMAAAEEHACTSEESWATSGSVFQPQGTSLSPMLEAVNVPWEPATHQLLQNCFPYLVRDVAFFQTHRAMPPFIRCGCVGRWYPLGPLSLRKHIPHNPGLAVFPDSLSKITCGSFWLATSIAGGTWKLYGTQPHHFTSPQPWICPRTDSTVFSSWGKPLRFREYFSSFSGVPHLKGWDCRGHFTSLSL